MNEIEKAQQENQKALIALTRIVSEASESINKAFNEARIASEQLEARLEELSNPVEREYRAGEWVPEDRQQYCFTDSTGKVDSAIYDPSVSGHIYRGKIGIAYPTKAIAEAAKEHADWWREFDKSDEGGDFYICVNRDNDIRVCECDRIADGTPRSKNEMSARAAIERLGGEQKVIEMLNKGRVFRFKCGGQ